MKIDNRWFWALALIGLIGLGIYYVSPASPFTEEGWFAFETTDEGGLPNGTGSGYLKYNGEKTWTNTKFTFEIRNRADENGGYTDTAADAITVRVYKGVSGSISDPLAGCEYQETVICSGGTGTTALETYNSKEYVTLVVGTYDAAEDGDNPLKTQIYQAVVQGEDAINKPIVSIGTGYFDYLPSPDEDDLTFDIVDKDLQDYSQSTSFDWSDDSDNIIEMNAKVQFTDPEFGLYSYYDYANKKWFNWYVAGHIEEKNCTTVEAATIHANNEPSAYQAASNRLNFYIELTSPHVWTNPLDDITDAAEYGYFTNTAGDVYSGYDSTFYVPFALDLISCTPGGNPDNYQEMQLFFQLGTGSDTARILNAGSLLADVDNNYNVACNDDVFIIT